MGKGSKTPKPPGPGPMEVEQTRQLKEYYNKFQGPGQAQVGPQVLSGFADNNLFGKEPDPYARDTMEQQFGQAKNQILNSAPVRGGRLAREMTGLAKDRAMGVSGLYAQKGQEARGQLTNMLPALFPNAAANQSTMSGIAGAQNSRNMAAWQQGNANQQATGAGLGGLLGGIGNAFMQPGPILNAGQTQAPSLMSSLLGGLGTGIMGLFGSSRTLKDDIEPVTEDILQQLADTPVYIWRYKGDERRHIGPVTEEAPAIIVTNNGMALDGINYLGFMFAAIKALEVKVKKLEADHVSA